MPPNKEGCTDCVQFAVVHTKLEDLVKGLLISGKAALVAFTLLVSVLSWGSLELYKLNGKVSQISVVDKQIVSSVCDVTKNETKRGRQ